MKKIISSILISLVILNCLCFPALAATPSDGHKEITPIAYKLLKTKMRSSSNEDIAREALLYLGVPENIAKNMQKKEILNDIYNATEFNSYTIYNKIKEDGSSVTVTEEEYLKAEKNTHNANITPRADTGYKEGTDKYFKKTILYFWLDDEKRYVYWTCFEWLTSPVFTSEDVCGIHVTSGSLTDDSGFAAFSYNTINGFTGKITAENYNEYAESDYVYDPKGESPFKTFDRTITFKFNLPTKISNSAIYTDMGVALVCKGRPEHIELTDSYNIYASYHHRIVKLIKQPSIDAIGGNLGFTVSPEWQYNQYDIDNDIDYAP